MIFDLKSGKRRRVVQIVFGFLAFIFFISFVGFGIGSDVSGGIFDAIGLGGDDNNTDIESTYEQQIEDAQKKLDDNPKDEKALTNLARYRYLAGQENLSFDEESGVASITDDARSEWDSALDAWEKLTKQKPDKLDVQVASQMICAYVPPLPACAVQAPLDQVNLQGAAATQKLLAEQEDSAAAYGAAGLLLLLRRRLEVRGRGPRRGALTRERERDEAAREGSRAAAKAGGEVRRAAEGGGQGRR